MKQQILVTDSVHPLLITEFEKMGFECHYNSNISPAETHAIIHRYEGLIINSKIKIDARFLEVATQLRFIGRLGSGMEIIDQIAAKHKNVAVFNSPEGNANAVGEHALGMLLALLNNLTRADAQVRQNIWEREANRGAELIFRTVGIVGFGHTGTAFARKLGGMDVQVLAYDKYKKNYAAGFPYVQEVSSLSPIFERADVVSFHLPYTAETHHLASAAFWRQFATSPIVINTSRGAVVNTADLVEALESGKVSGVCLDVFENEKVASYSAAEKALYARLHALPNVVLTPHIAGWTVESKRRMAEVLLQKVGDWLAA